MGGIPLETLSVMVLMSCGTSAIQNQINWYLTRPDSSLLEKSESVWTHETEFP